ncbi:Hypothetical protein MCYN_0384 [Mycoplasmopsis cynos C142]|uniref:Uncharacterized protein n=1 Tax=Mycoplasmopsis cynos (strain C142) TaxID=1246955 RepID=L0RX00_MYCC1|nr:Hypothetical protein MCYN_0384 [Mycoplasmopsis cynos C142]
MKVVLVTFRLISIIYWSFYIRFIILEIFVFIININFCLFSVRKFNNKTIIML